LQHNAKSGNAMLARVSALKELVTYKSLVESESCRSTLTHSRIPMLARIQISGSSQILKIAIRVHS